WPSSAWPRAPRSRARTAAGPTARASLPLARRPRTSSTDVVASQESETEDVPVITGAERRARLKAAPHDAPATLKRLAKQHPEAAIELKFGSPFQLIVAVVLSE